MVQRHRKPVVLVDLSSSDEEEEGLTVVRGVTRPVAAGCRAAGKRCCLQEESAGHGDNKRAQWEAQGAGDQIEAESTVEQGDDEDADTDSDCQVVENFCEQQRPTNKVNSADAGASSASQHADSADDEDMIVTHEVGEVAGRDWPHARASCATFPFNTTLHVKHCRLCHCWVCDRSAPCAKWGSGNDVSDHCHASDKDPIWVALRGLAKGRPAAPSQPRATTTRVRTAVTPSASYIPSSSLGLVQGNPAATGPSIAGSSTFPGVLRTPVTVLPSKSTPASSSSWRDDPLLRAFMARSVDMARASSYLQPRVPATGLPVRPVTGERRGELLASTHQPAAAAPFRPRPRHVPSRLPVATATGTPAPHAFPSPIVLADAPSAFAASTTHAVRQQHAPAVRGVDVADAASSEPYCPFTAVSVSQQQAAPAQAPDSRDVSRQAPASGSGSTAKVLDGYYSWAYHEPRDAAVEGQRESLAATSNQWRGDTEPAVPGLVGAVREVEDAPAATWHGVAAASWAPPAEEWNLSAHTPATAAMTVAEAAAPRPEATPAWGTPSSVQWGEYPAVGGAVGGAGAVHQQQGSGAVWGGSTGLNPGLPASVPAAVTPQEAVWTAAGGWEDKGQTSTRWWHSTIHQWGVVNTEGAVQQPATVGQVSPGSTESMPQPAGQEAHQQQATHSYWPSTAGYAAAGVGSQGDGPAVTSVDGHCWAPTGEGWQGGAAETDPWVAWRNLNQQDSVRDQAYAGWSDSGAGQAGSALQTGGCTDAGGYGQYLNAAGSFYGS